MNDNIRERVTDTLEMARLALADARKHISFAVGHAEDEQPIDDDLLESLFILHNWIGQVLAELEGVLVQAKEVTT